MIVQLELNEREIKLLYHTMCDKFDEEFNRECELKNILKLRVDNVLKRNAEEGLKNSNMDQKSYLRIKKELEKHLTNN